jgi:hypothetical protein
MTRLWHLAVVEALVLVVAAIGCAPPDRGASTVGARLYVINGAEASVSLVDPGSGQGQGALTVPRGAWQVVPGRRGREEGLLALAAPDGALTHFRRTGHGGAWVPQPVAPEPGAVIRLVAGDGAHHAAAAYAPRSEDAGVRGAACRLALIDAVNGRVERTATVCAGGADTVQAIALRRGPDGPVAFVALWRQAAAAPGGSPAGGRLATVHLQTGAAVASAPLPGVPEQLLVAPAPEGAGQRLYAVTATTHAAASRDSAVGAGALAAEATEWRLTGFDPDTLLVETEQALSHRPLWLSVTPDGRRAFAVAGPTSLLTPSVVLRVDLVGGSASLIREAPGRAMGLAVTGDRLFLADPDGRQLWVLDHRARPVRTFHTGQHPIAVVLTAP